MKAKKTSSPKISVSLALQGGGSHGAFTWGVLDRLLEDTSLQVEGVSGTSAGSINAAALACGMIKGEHEGSKKELEKFWRALSHSSGAFNPYQTWHSTFGFDVFSFWNNMFSQVFSPSQLNPFNYNPLQGILRKTIDFDALQKTNAIKLFISATNVETNRVKIFENNELCEEALLASSCLPTFFQAVKWKENYYWDGGYMANPMLEPLIYNCGTKDIIIVPINPIHRKGAPTTSREILDRLNEITFNASLMREIRDLIKMEKLSTSSPTDNPFMGVRLHCIQNEKFMRSLGANSKYNTDWAFLRELKDVGRETAHQWIKENFKSLGKKATMDLTEWRMETPSTTCLQFPK